ncbi:hypothetical protein [Streptomyces cupreus]|uniref:Uncharacterized protein n=1 Tax=Streptomyces cupreus TaxID=2759956 RepID=A0A7X1J639_9ACTN|nr:hypothetical protein [Streptomyces cupreus]MBC2904801.1 hypothetical protein [Streptomyces cupreus]
MNRLLTGLARTGDAWDAMTAAAMATPHRLRAALTVPRHRRTGLIAAAVVLVVYLFSIGDLAVSASGRFTGVPMFQTAWERVFHVRAPYLFEPVVAVHPSAHLAVFVSPLNLLLGGIVAALVGCNIAVAGLAARQAAACRTTSRRKRRGYARLLGMLPAFLLGFACCAPTILLILGTGTAAALLPVLIPLRPVFYPLTLVLLTAALVGQSREPRVARMSAGSARRV